MKFTQLPVGQRFAYQGDTLVKLGPMTACNERGGNTRLIPRSAVVVPLTAQPASGGRAPVDGNRLQDALAGFEASWRGVLEGLDEVHRVRIEQALVSAQAELLRSLAVSTSSP